MIIRKTNWIFLLAGCLFMGGCVSNSKFNASQQALQSVRNDSAQLANKVSTLESTVAQLKTEVGNLNAKVSEYSADAANKSSQLNQSREQLLQLQALMDQQKKAIEDIRKKMTEALVGFTSNELTVSIKNGK